jgi:primosomal replication protein N
VDANAVTLTGAVAEAEPLRHTPAGLPLLQFKLAHRSWQVEAGHERQVECILQCVALGAVATSASASRSGDRIRVNGFLNRRNRMSTQLVLHVTGISASKED